MVRIETRHQAEKSSLIRFFSDRWFPVASTGNPVRESPLKPKNRDQKLVVEARQMRRAGRTQDAMALLRDHFLERAGLPVILEYWHQACQNQLNEDKVFAGRALVVAYVGERDSASAHFYWRRLNEMALLERVDFGDDLVLELVQLLADDYFADEAMAVLERHLALGAFGNGGFVSAVSQLVGLKGSFAETLLGEAAHFDLSEEERARVHELAVLHGFETPDAFSAEMEDQGPATRFEVEPEKLGENSFLVRFEDGAYETIRYSAMAGVFLGAVDQPRGRPYLVIDLLVSGSGSGNRVLRISTRRFNPRRVMPHAVDAYAAYLKMAELFLNGSSHAIRPNTVVDLGLLPMRFNSEREMECEFYGRAVA